MPRISFFFGIAIYMYWDEGQHQQPHFHAEYASHMASVGVDGSIIGGALPPRAERFVREWAALHLEELRANWDRARAQQRLEPIEPLA